MAPAPSPPEEPPVLCVAIVGRDGSLLFFRSFRRKMAVPPDADDLELQLLLHAALDQVEVQMQNVAQALLKGEAKGSDPYLGLLSPALFDAQDSAQPAIHDTHSSSSSHSDTMRL
ncbi:unnamed protein product [Symbiodinium sp. CCMP2592]|nr:unnamed protein product [Symbiodinium sp. CCMP2592]